MTCSNSAAHSVLCDLKFIKTNMLTPEQYRKTWYYRFYPRGFEPRTFLPKNGIGGRPITVFGFRIGWLFKIAKRGYPWSNSNKYREL